MILIGTLFGNPLLTGSDYLDDKEYYIGYINNNTSSTSANAVRYATAGHATTPTSGKFSLTNGGGAGVLYGWQEASTIVLNPIDHEGNDQSNWISSIRIGDIVTIRQRGNPNNYGMYKINTVWTELPISVEPVVAGIEYITHDNKGAPQATPGISATTDGYVVAPLPATTINGEVIDAVNFDRI